MISCRVSMMPCPSSVTRLASWCTWWTLASIRTESKKWVWMSSYFISLLFTLTGFGGSNPKQNLILFKETPVWWMYFYFRMYIHVHFCWFIFLTPPNKTKTWLRPWLCLNCFSMKTLVSLARCYRQFFKTIEIDRLCIYCLPNCGCLGAHIMSYSWGYIWNANDFN